MSVERFVLAFAGLVILTSLALSQLHAPEWLYLTGFVGLNLFQSAFTGFCPLARILERLGLKHGQAFT